MPLYVPTPLTNIAKTVWEYTTRELTYDSAHEFTHSAPVAGGNAYEYDVTDVNAHILEFDAAGHPNVTVAFNPIQKPLFYGAYERGSLVVILYARNIGGVAQSVTVNVRFRKAGGAWRSVSGTNRTLVVPAVTNSVVSYLAIDDIRSDLVVGGDGNYEVQVEVQQSNAAQIRYSPYAIMTYGLIGEW